jgi:hypothetical protein
MIGKISINFGVDKIINKKHKTKEEQMNEEALSQLRTLRSKMNSILAQTNVMSVDNAQKFCVEIENMKSEDRSTFIELHWGKLYAEKAQPLLHQIKTLENSLFD